MVGFVTLPVGLPADGRGCGLASAVGGSFLRPLAGSAPSSLARRRGRTPLRAVAATETAAPVSDRRRRAQETLERLRQARDAGTVPERPPVAKLPAASGVDSPPQHVATEPMRRERPAPTPELSRPSTSASSYAKSAESGPRYNSAEAELLFANRMLEVRRRQVQIALPLFGLLSQVVVDWQLGREKEMRPTRARAFLDLVAGLGPAFIKAGQALSSRPDLLPEEYLVELQKLQDRLPPVPNEVALAVIEQELGRPASEVFERFEETPVAAASIGQVYKAYLKSGETVAVKVQRPNCEETIAMDLFILMRLSGSINGILKMLGRDIDLQSIIEEFGKLIYEEIDYVNEARNAERFNELYGHLPDVMVPKVYWEFSRRRVLTLDWVSGRRLTSSDLNSENTRLVQTMVQCSLRQMLENGYFHADPHGGNMLAVDTGELCYLDFGMMSEVEPAQRYGIIEAVIHMVNRDFESLANLYVRLGFLPPETDLEPIVAALNEALPDVLGASVEELNFKSVIDKLGAVMYKYPFSLPPYYTAIIRCLGVLEGLAIQVDPKFKILNDAYPYIASRLLIDPAPELQDALQYLLFKDGRARWNRLESLLDSAKDSTDYDLTLAMSQMIDLLLSSRCKEIRYNLADDIVEEIDALGADVTLFSLGLVAQSLREAGVRLPVLARIPEPVQTPSMVTASKIVDVLRQGNSLQPAKVMPIFEKFISEPEGQRIGIEMAVSLAEKATTRLVRSAFDLPDNQKV